MEHLPHLFTQFDGFEHLDAIAVFHQVILKIDCGADVEGEVRVVLRAGDLALRMVERQHTQVVGCPVVGAYDYMSHRCLVCQHAMHSEGGEEPTLDAVVAEHLLITDVVLIRLGFAMNGNAEHVMDGIAMAVERRTLQWFAVGHAVVLPLLLQFLEGQFMIGPERIDDPDVLVKYLSWFHACKDSHFLEKKQKST